MTPGAVASKSNGHEKIKTNPWQFTVTTIFCGLATIVFSHFQTLTACHFHKTFNEYDVLK